MAKVKLIFACFFICVYSLAQQYPFVHYTPRDGLVNSRVRKAYQDSKGRLYFLTFGGLSMYDGSRFRNYTKQNGLPTDFVNDILETGDDSLLVATNTCGLNMLISGQMKKVQISGDNCPVVNHLLKSPEGTIYATTDDGLYTLKRNRFEKLSTLIKGQNEQAIYLGTVVDYKDFLVFTTNELTNFTGLFLYSKKNNIIINALPQIHVFSLTKDRSGIIWLSTSDKVVNLDTAAISIGKLVLVDPYASYFKSNKFYPGTIAFNLQNEPLIFSADKGIICYCRDETKLNITAPEISGFVIENFLIDRENIIWICHDGNGVYKLSNTKLQFLNFLFGTDKLKVRTAKANTPDSCWIVMNNNQLILHSLLKTKNYLFNSSINAKAVHYNKDHLFIVEDHKLYTAAIPDEQTGVIPFKKILTLSDTSLFGKIMVNDPYGQVILSQTFNICVLKKDKILFTYPISKNDLIEGMYIDKHNKLWMVSRSAGLQIFSIHPENPPQYLQKERQFIKEFEGVSPRCITIDKNEMLWVGTRDDGLIGFEYKNNQLIKQYHFQTQNGLTDNFITALACDKNNNLLVGTQTGLDRLIKGNEGYSIENITKSNNIFSNITYVWTDTDDNAFILSNTGSVFQMQPVKKNNSIFEPQLLIEEIKINGKVLRDFQAPLRLQYQQSNITFSMAAISFIDEKQIKYSYLLSGSGNKKWSDTTSQADITFLNLAPGKYTLQVKAFFYSTTYSPKTIAFSFVILPPWWQTWWLRAMALIVVVAVIFWLIRFYFHRKLLVQKNILEKQQAIEKERTRIAADMHDELGAGLSTLRFLSEKVKRNSFSDVTRKDAGKIVDSSNDLVQKMNEIIWAMNEKNDTLEDLLFYARSYAVEYCEENNLHCNTHLPETVPTCFVSGEVRRNVFLTIKESLHNIIKHAAAKHVSINFAVDKNLVITVKDDGKGMTKNNGNEGNGLRNMQKRIESVGGKFNVQNINGLMVKMSVPLLL